MCTHIHSKLSAKLADFSGTNPALQEQVVQLVQPITSPSLSES